MREVNEIEKVFEEIDEDLKKRGNELLILDFSHFSQHGDSNSFDIFFKCIAKDHCKNLYEGYLEGLQDDSEAVWRKFKDSSKRLVNFNNSRPESFQVKSQKGISEFTLDPVEDVKVKDDFSPKKHLVNDFCGHSELMGLGECFIVYSENYKNTQSVLYVLLKNKIDKGRIPDDKDYDLDEHLDKHKTIKDIDPKLNDLLIQEMVNSLAEEKNKLLDKTKRHAIHNAVSQITARNYAHHIGSHVKHRATLSKIRERLSNIYSL